MHLRNESRNGNAENGVRVLFLTNNANLGSTSRILQSWLTLGRQRNLFGQVVVQRSGDFANWLAEERFVSRVDPMPWPNRRWPVPSLWHAARIAYWARRAGVQIIHCNEHDVFPFALLLRKFLRLPVVCHVRYVIARGFAEWTFAGRQRLPDALLWTSFQQQSDCAAAIDDIVPRDRQHVVRLGLDLKQFGNRSGQRDVTRSSLGIRPDEIVLGTASPLRPRKRVEDFVELVQRLAAQDPRVVGLIAGSSIAGDEDYRAEIVGQIDRTGLGRRLRWLGNLNDVEPFYHACDVVISTSAYETFGNSVCEAMACQRAVVAYQGGSVQEVAGDAGMIVATGDREALLAATQRLTHDAQARDELGARARQRVAELFDPADSLRQLEGIYGSLLMNGCA